MTPEQVRFHAAGHIAAAHDLAVAGHGAAASHVLGIVLGYMRQRGVDCPPPMIASIEHYCGNPAAHLRDIKAVEELFTHPANTMLEQAGVRL